MEFYRIFRIFSFQTSKDFIWTGSHRVTTSSPSPAPLSISLLGGLVFPFPIRALVKGAEAKPRIFLGGSILGTLGAFREQQNK